MSKWLFETDRLRLRPVTVEDAGLMLAVWNDPAFIRNVADRGIRTEAQALQAIRDGAQKLFDDYGYGPYCMSLKSDGAMVGICGLFRRENLDDPDIGFAVLPDYCGKGLASEASFAVLDYASKSLQLDKLLAIVSPENAASIGLIEKLGMRFDRMITMPGETEAICLYDMSISAAQKG
ncbi:MAG: GNAT family N-acetyltransferase [Gammaproteobacteria bacterium]|nr:GNAT family N-acetyltransferase [Gammaproteobacteria bacterium]